MKVLKVSAVPLLGASCAKKRVSSVTWKGALGVYPVAVFREIYFSGEQIRTRHGVEYLTNHTKMERCRGGCPDRQNLNLPNEEH